MTVFSITNHQRNAYHNHSEVPPYPSKNDHYQKYLFLSADEDMEKERYILCSWECKTFTHYGKQYGNSFKA